MFIIIITIDINNNMW